MPLILAVDRDRRQATQLVSLVRKRFDAELVHASTAAEALEALEGRVPDLILTSPLLSPKDDGLLAGHLRKLGQKAAHVQTLTIPVLRASKPGRSKSGVMSKLRRDKVKAPNTDGCDPEVFAEEIGVYLARAAEERQARVARESPGSDETTPTEPPPQTAEIAQPPVVFAELVETSDATAPADDVSTLASTEVPAIVEEAVLRADHVEPANTENADPIEPERYETAEPMMASAEEYPASPEIDDPIREAAADFEPPPAPIDAIEVSAAAAPEYVEPAASFDHAAELAAEDAIASVVNELRDVDREVLDPSYPSSLEDALAAVNATLTALENTPHEATRSASAAKTGALRSDGPTRSPESRRASDPSVSVPLDRLVALFADLPHDEGHAPVVEPGGEAMAAEASRTRDAVAKAHKTAVRAAEKAALVAATPVLDDESLAAIGEAARKASLDASALNEPAPVKSAPRVRPARSSAKPTEIDLSSEIEAIAPEEPDKEAGAAESSSAEASESKDAHGKKRPRRRGKGPIQDEWGLFDPEQCGFSALVDKLDEVTDTTEEQKPQPGTRVRVISY